MCTVAELGNEIAELAARLDAATHRLLQCIWQFDQSNEWYAQGAVSCAHWLCWRIGLDQGTAREKVRVARALGELPESERPLEPGGCLRVTFGGASPFPWERPPWQDRSHELAKGWTGLAVARVFVCARGLGGLVWWFG